MNIFKQYLAEGIGTFILVFVGAGAVMANTLTNGGVGLVGIALAFGSAVMTMVYVFGRISGAHLNPAVTIALLADKKINLKDSLGYIAAQLTGATLAGVILFLSFGSLGFVGKGVTTLSSSINASQGVLIEALLTFFLVLTVLNLNNGGVVIGLVIAMDILMGGALTGASMNPARTFGPALVSGVWINHWVYWVGPILGGLAAVLVSKIWK